ncbi:hypothetical protein SDRG_00538 [Saprolegnia diclina VS20]|uniref:ABC transporter domain-containing protein n=1 Tax=Saprolegnia diclina (strain VS20) TaxID=1156394 RepID=T0SBL6_SAPDV|nr:hypothetical protein SDRG_00538 [Saprolegnia diclina VS20]EQC42818.1 hypothetical protein SDRG_00538 [Saprolegnia diclina VS20]|eukprot:XP_008604241.1 hypothetical protein SDRG_00538 [Saprolegnia diclina VS20]
MQQAGQADDLLAQGTAAYHSKIKDEVGGVLPPLEIRFTDLALSADVPLMTRQELPTLMSDVTSMVRGLYQPSRTVRKDILHPMTGTLTPGTMTLVLGQPRSGKSSFFKLLSGQVKTTKSLRMDGQLTYNGVSDMGPHLARWTSYVAQRDVHYPTLTVHETLSFASRCVTSREQLAAVPEHATPLLASIEAAAPDLVARQLGLAHCKDTVVGNSMLRGVSGGERKRVTMGEMEFGFKRASFLDEISTGLDAAATFDIVSAQKSLATSLQKTVVIALLQPAQDVFDLFDNVLLLHDGYTLYHGPRDACMPYFEALGYSCPPHRDVPDFLVDIGSPDLDGPSLSARELASAFLSSSVHAAMLARMQQTPSLPPLAPIAPFAEPFLSSTMAIALRQLRVYLRNAELLLAYCLPDVDLAGLVGFLFNSIFMLFMGFAPPASQIPSGFRWLYSVVPPKFSMAILAAETFAKCTEGHELGCKTLAHVPPSVLQAMGNASSITLQEYVEGVYEMKYDDASTNTLATLGWIAIILVLNAIALRFVNHQKK